MIKKLKIVRLGDPIEFETGVKVPYSEMKGPGKTGEEMLIFMGGDTPTAKIYNNLQTNHNYKTGDWVTGIVYDIRPEMGALFAVDEKYHGLIPLNEIYSEVRIGASLHARVTRINEGKMRLTLKERAAVQVIEDQEIIMKALEEKEGVLFINDKTEPFIIKRNLNLSKRAFKRAVGRLLSEGRIDIFEDGIKKIK